jgi:hypothetical protein
MDAEVHDGIRDISSYGFVPSDGRYLQTSSESVASYGTVVISIGEQFEDIFSTNPFNVDAKAAKSVIIFVGLFVLIFVMGCVFFLRWDAYDHYILVYAKEGL